MYVGTLGCDDKCVFADPCHNVFFQNIAMTDIPNFKVRQQYRSGESADCPPNFCMHERHSCTCRLINSELKTYAVA